MATIMITQRNPKLFTQKKPNETLLCKSVTSVCQFQIKFEFAGFSRWKKNLGNRRKTFRRKEENKKLNLNHI